MQFKKIFLCVMISVVSSIYPYADELAKPACDRFFYMNTWFWQTETNVDQQCEVLKDIGVTKQSYPLRDQDGRLDQFMEAMETFKQEGIEIIAVYNTVSIDQPNLPDRVVEAMEYLQGSNTLIWLALTSEDYKPSSPEGDQTAIEFLKKSSEQAKKYGLEISLYPHVNFWLQSTDDIVRIMPDLKDDHQNIGATFNLYHWLKVEGPDNLEQKAQAMLPYLNCVTINGSFYNAKDMPVRDAILPLGEGDYDVQQFVSKFEELGYSGPIGHQGWGIVGDVIQKMHQAHQQWLKMCNSAN